MADSRINKDTLMPVGIVVGIVAGITSLVWTMASDRTFVMETLKTHNERLNRAEVISKDMSASLHRIEIRLGTLPGNNNPLHLRPD